MYRQLIRSLAPALVTGLALLSLAGCSKQPAPAASGAPADAAATSPATGVAGQSGDAAAADAARAAELAAKERELADREAAVKQQELEAELARRDAEAAKQAAAAAAAKKPPAKASPAQVASAQPQPKPAPPPATPIVVPAGTPLSITLVSAVTTKTAVVGDAVQGQLASDLVVDGRRAAAAGSAVTGTVTQVVSGSRKIGGTPTLGITFDKLSAGSSGSVAISARLLQQATSDTGKDTAKVVGTTAAGAIIGHQVSHKNGAIVGGLIGGAAGLGIAQKTGGEVSLAAGTVVSAPLDGAVQFSN